MSVITSKCDVQMTINQILRMTHETPLKHYKMLNRTNFSISYNPGSASTHRRPGGRSVFAGSGSVHFCLR